MPFLTALIPAIGVFFNNRIGWLLIIGYFNFAAISLIFSLTKSDFTLQMNLLLLTVGILLIVPSILLMNSKKIYAEIYKIPESKIFSLYIVAFSSALIVFLLAIAWRFSAVL